MKRFGDLYQKIISIENLELADLKARKGKGQQYGIRLFDKNKQNNLMRLHEMLKNKTYHTSAYTTFKIYEPKERVVYRLPYFPDRILHHAVMNYLEGIFVSVFTADTYSCIKGRGIHAASFAIRKSLLNVNSTKYCLKLDVKKFYPSIDHVILKQLIRRKIKDRDLLWLLDEIIDSAVGVPIGNYLSQYFANFYLTYFDHWIKEQMLVIDYVRYADDIAIFHSQKEYLHYLLNQIRIYWREKLNLEIKENYQIFLLKSRGLDMVGYVHFHDCVYVRKSIKKSFGRAVFKRSGRASIDSYMGWLRHCNGINLTRKILNAA